MRTITKYTLGRISIHTNGSNNICVDHARKWNMTLISATKVAQLRVITCNCNIVKMQYHLKRSLLEWSNACTSPWPTITSFSTSHIFSSSFPYRSWAILNTVSCEIETCYKMTPTPPCLFALWYVFAFETKVVWQEGPFLMCHSMLIQYLVVHNCKPKKSLQNFTSFVQCCGNNIAML